MKITSLPRASRTNLAQDRAGEPCVTVRYISITMNRSRARNLRSTGVALVFSLSLAATVRAHDTWIGPLKPVVKVGESATVEGTSGMKFPELETAVAPDRIRTAAYRVGNATKPVSEKTKSPKSITLRIRPESAGVVTVWLESKPRAIDLKPDQVPEYLEEIGADEIARDWKSEGSGGWHETYTKHAKTFLRTDPPAEDRSWMKPVGMDLEIVPETDPTQVRTGDEVSFLLLEAGRPLPDFPVTALAAGTMKGTLAKTNSEGKVRFRLDRKGWWLIKGTHVVRGNAKGTWDSHFSTVTILAGGS